MNAFGYAIAGALAQGGQAYSAAIGQQELERLRMMREENIAEIRAKYAGKEADRQHGLTVAENDRQYGREVVGYKEGMPVTREQLAGMGDTSGVISPQEYEAKTKAKYATPKDNRTSLQKNAAAANMSIEEWQSFKNADGLGLMGAQPQGKELSDSKKEAQMLHNLKIMNDKDPKEADAQLKELEGYDPVLADSLREDLKRHRAKLNQAKQSATRSESRGDASINSLPEAHYNVAP